MELLRVACFVKFAQQAKERCLGRLCQVLITLILVPRAYDPSGLRQESRALWEQPFRTCALDEDWVKPDRMGTIRLFPLLFQNGCSQSSRFLPQARRIVGSGDEDELPSENKDPGNEVQKCASQ